MIKGVVGSGSVVVNGGYSTYPSFPMNTQNPVCGMMRYNPNMTNVEVFDGNNWHVVSTALPTVSLSPVTETIIAWAAKKMEDENYILGLSREYPAIKDLLDQQNDIRHKIDMVIALVKPEKKH